MNKTELFILLFIFVIKSNSQYETFAPSGYLNKKFQEYNIICLDEAPHGTLQSHSFIRSLLSNDSVYSQLDYLIIEFANTKYQDIVDKYISGGDIPLAELQRIWINISEAHNPLFEMQVYLKLLNSIRNVNKNPGGSHKIRVLAGDPEFDWSKITSINDYLKNISQRDVLPSELAIKYGIDSEKNVLLIYGGEHLKKGSNTSKDSTYLTIPYYINKKYPNRVFTIGILNSDNFNYKNIPLNLIIEFPDNKADYDAFYFVGNSSNFETDKPEKIDKAYWEEMKRRAVIVWGQELDKNLIKNP